MWRHAVAAFFVAHRFAHLVGFQGSWGLGQSSGNAKAPSLLSGIHTTTLKVIGVLWLIGLLAFLVAAAAGVALETSWAKAVTGTAASFSLVISLVWWPDAWVGIVINVAILAVLIASLVVANRRPRIAGSRRYTGCITAVATSPHAQARARSTSPGASLSISYLRF